MDALLGLCGSFCKYFTYLSLTTSQGRRMRPPTDPLRVKPSCPKSLVWQHFDNVMDGQHVFCLLCRAKNKDQRYKITDNNTSSLRKAYLHSSTLLLFFYYLQTRKSDIRLTFTYGLVVANKTRQNLHCSSSTNNRRNS